MNVKRSLLLFIFLFSGSLTFAQTRVNVLVKDAKTGDPVEGVSVLDTKGALLGKTNMNGGARITVAHFPVFFEKNGYRTNYAYSEKDLNPVWMRSLGGEIPSVTVYGKDEEDSLLSLRDKNLPFFYEKDTTIYYHFKYDLSLPDLNWEESADGYIALNFKGVGVTPSAFNLFRYAYFVQFNYQSSDENKILPPSKIMPVVLMFGNDFMSGFGYPLWEKLNRSYLAKDKRAWYLQSDKNGDKIFSAYSTDEDSRLMEKIVFNRKSQLQTISLFTPEEIPSIGSVTVFNNFSKNNGINSFRTVYTYSPNDTNRLLASVEHLSTYYDKDRVYYEMKFSAQLSTAVPKETCKIPVYYLAYNHYHPEQNGYGVWLSLQQGYNINHDRWLKIQDKAVATRLKEIREMKEEQETEAKNESSAVPHKSAKH